MKSYIVTVLARHSNPHTNMHCRNSAQDPEFCTPLKQGGPWLDTFLISQRKSIAVAQWLRCCAINRKVAGSIRVGVIENFHWYKILPIVLWPCGWPSLQEKWIPGAIPGGKGSRCVRLTTLQPSCAVVAKSGNRHILESSGPLRTHNGTVLPLLLTGRAAEVSRHCFCISSRIISFDPFT